ncbi:hypothetical protein CDD80_1873 [Ophiocordyceps camponoti-rufipedis]|uniref:Carrier domain-containing protein n=1 Tax=Ophiocordyceps camponoti-rufipedis TaxID=2004952 RepID=A0A2C5Z9E9_9HYPO|nr:hypothetical protein CDD80_1873 [Ophiocordyceps camponoti-rufipedis]
MASNASKEGDESRPSLEMAPCLFPTLNGRDDDLNSSRCLALPLPVDALLAFSEQHRFKLLQATWALVLQSYTGTDSPSFMSRHGSCWLHTCLDLSEDVELLQIVESISTEKVDSSSHGLADRVNTAVEWESLDIGRRQCRGEPEPRFDVSLHARGTGEDWSVCLRYKPAMLSEIQADEVGSVIAHIVAQMLQGPVRLSAIDTCTRHTVETLKAWNRRRPETISRCIHHVVLDNCSAYPDSAAVCAWDGDFSYRDLDNLTATLSRHLISRGIGAEKFVGIYTDKSKWTVIGILSVLRAGGAFTLLDTSFPASRIAIMCEKLQVELLLCSDERFDEASAFNLPVLQVDDELMNRLSSEALPTRLELSVSVTPENAALAVFTSGSTGIPKGIVFNHTSVCSGQSATIARVGYGPGTRALQFASYAFDLSVQEHLTPLMAGACVCIPSETARKSKLDEAIRQMGVNLAVLTPTVSRLLQPAEVGTLKKLLLAVNPSDREKLLPIGGVGELLIQGPIVGRGYVGDKDQTESRFISAPGWRCRFPVLEGTHDKLYCTGDLVQYVGDGMLRYIGRRDSQVKIHGQRLELAEVERGLLEMLPEGCHALATVVHPADDSSPVLAGFVLSPGNVGSEGQVFADASPQFRQLAERVMTDLAGRLPLFMIPSVLIPLTTIPTSRSGKGDRRVLASLASAYTRRELYAFCKDTAGQLQSPTTKNEELLHQAVEQVLGVNNFSMGDNFFSLGGDSVRAMLLARQTREAAGLEVTVENILKSATLSELASTMCPSRESVDIAPFSLLSGQDSVEETLSRARSCCRLSSVDDVEDIYPCTALQEGITALSMSSHEAKYVTSSTYRLPRAVDVQRLRRAWDSVVASNPVLRTRILQSATGQVLQAVLKTAVEWEVVADLAELERLQRQWRVEIGGPLLRLAMVSTSRGNYFSVFISHALYDGWSLPETLKQVEAAYHGETISSKPFKHFVSHVLASDEAQARQFWLESLKHYSAQPFPSAPAGQLQYRPAALQTLRRSVSIPDSRSPEWTLSTAILLAWAVTVSQYTGSDDVCFGTTLSGRNTALSGVDRILGPTITTIPLRTQLDRTQTVQNVLSSLHRWLQDSIPHQHLGTQRIASLGTEAAAASRFHNHLVIQPPPSDETSTIFADGDTWEVVDNYMLALQVILPKPVSDVLCVEVSYDDTAVSQWKMTRIADQFCHNVLQILSNPSKTFRDLDDMDFAGRRIIMDWNRRLPDVVDCCAHDLISRRCLGQAASPAVDAFDGSLTYGQLDEQTTQLAAHLQEKGAGPGTYVMIMLERSLWAVVAILAVMKSGAAFVVVDLSTPDSRLEQIRDETEPILAITSPLNVGRATELHLPVVIAHHGSSWLAAGGEQQMFKPPSVSSQDIVYAVFTSGSTGRPKGIAVPHRALATGASISGRSLTLGPGSRALHASSYAFDASIAEIIYTLVQGGCVCVPSEADSRNCLEDAIGRFHIDWASLTPSLTRALNPAKMSTIRTLIWGGEAVTRADVEMWPQSMQLINAYGPAECTIDSTFQHNVSLSSPANIGYGFATVTWIVDPDDPTCGSLVPLGAVGELVLEGPVVAEGYLNNPTKTASSFVNYPDWLKQLRRGQPGRLYRTGDLVQYSPSGDGSLLYLGRKDNQVKLRGQRLELEEVEQHLMDCLPAAKAVVAEIVKPCDAGAAPALAAFILLDGVSSDETGDEILASGDSPLCAQLGIAEARMASRVPRFMVPGLYLPLLRLPTSVAGKANRRLLREMASALTRKQLKAYSSSALQPQAPSTVKDRALHEGVCEVLKLPPLEVGVNSNFFQLGGDSITAMKLAGRLQDAGFSLSVADVFKHGTLESLAATLEENRFDQDSFSRTIPAFALLPEAQRRDTIQAVARECGVSLDDIEDVYPCTPMQEGLLSLTMKQPGQYVAELIFDLPPETDLARVRTAWDAVYAANAILRSRVVTLRSGSGSSLQAVVREPLSWSSTLDPLIVDHGKPLLKVVLNEQDGRLHLWLHHALYDGVSLPILFEQAEAAYQGASSLPSSSFNAFAAYMEKLDAAAGRRFWTKEFRDLDTVLFPTSTRLQQPSASAGERESLSCSISIPDMNGLEFTLPSVIHAACAATLGHFAHTRDVVYGLTLTGRNAPVVGIDGLVGPTITTVPFRVQLRPSMTARALLSSIQEHLVSIMPYEQMGLQATRSINSECATACDFQCSVVIQPTDDETVKKKRIFGEPQTSSDEDSLFSSSPLALEFTVSSDRRSVHMVANFEVSVLDRGDASSFARHLEKTIQQIVKDADSQVQDLQEAGPHDLQRIESCNGSFRPTVDKLVQDLVKEQCRSRPGAEAVSSWDGSWTYSEVEDASSRLSKHLMSRGVSTGPVTAVYMDKSRWIVVAILSVLKSGSACVLLDNDYSEEQMRDMLRQTGAASILTSPEKGRMAESIAGGKGAAVIVVSTALLHSPPPSPPHSPKTIHSSDAAFAVFSSPGSAGKVDGMMLDHAAVTTGLRDLCGPHGLDETSRVLHCSSFASRAGLFEILGCLAVGGCLCIPSEQDCNVSRLGDFIESYGVNWAGLMSSAAGSIEPKLVPSLKTLMVRGEVVRSADVNRWAAARDDVRLVNSYSLRECPMICAVGRILPEEWTPGLIGPVVGGIGWVVNPDDYSRLCAVGAVGELMIESPVRSRRCAGDDYQLESSCIASPAWLSRIRGHGGSRLYRTGDLVQYTSRLDIRYLGRREADVKLSGRRVHLQEMESILMKHMPSDAVVVVDFVTTTTGRCQLFAFIQLPHQKQATDSKEGSLFSEPDQDFLSLCRAAKQSLSGLLSRDMMPTAFIPLTRFPRTTSGKINRRLLREKARDLRTPDLDLAKQPMSEDEINMARLWADVLQLPADEFCATDSFFHVGGDSIAAMKLVAAARERGLTVTVPEIFSHPHLADMASVVESSKQQQASSPDVAPFSLLPGDEREAVLEAAERLCRVQRADIEDCYPCTPMQEALFSQSMRSDGAFTAHFRYKLEPGVDVSRFQTAWERVMERNPVLRTRIVSTRAFYQVVLTRPAAWEVVDEDALEEAASGLCGNEVQLGCPLLRLLICPQSIEPEFCLVIHHALYDGWSLDLVLDQVQRTYKEQPLLVSQPWNHFIRYLGEQDQEAGRKHWLTQLSGATGAVFPALPAPDFKPFTDCIIRQEVKLEALPDVTRAAVLEFCWAVTASQYCKATGVSYGLVQSGRDVGVQGIESMTGPTIATIPVHLTLHKDEPVIQALRRLQGQRAAATPFQHFGLQNIRRLSRQTEAACRFQSLLLIQHAAAAAPDEEAEKLFTLVADGDDEAGNFSAHALEVVCEMTDDSSCVVEFHFDSSVLDPRQARRVLGQYVWFVEQVQSKSTHELSHLDLVSPSAKREMMEWNSVLPKVVDGCVHDGIQYQVDAEAVCAWDGSFTYRQLDALSSGLSLHLRSIGVGPETFVPVLCEKSKWVSVAILAVVRAGGAIVFLDGDDDLPRLRSICGSVDAGVVLSSQDFSTMAREIASSVIIIEQAPCEASSTNLVSTVASDNALYAVFDSDSQQGAVVSHGAFLTAFSTQKLSLDIDGDARTLQFAPHVSPTCIVDYLWTFLTGGCVCVASEDRLRHDVADAVCEFRVSRAEFTPSVVRTLRLDDMPTLMTVVLRHEALSKHEMHAWAAKVRLVYAYGLSETSGYCSLTDADVDSDPSTIGRAQSLLSWIVDRNKHDLLLPVGSVGELVLEGHALARGHLEAPELSSSSSFIDITPSWLRGSRTDTRLLRTGVLARYNPDGSLCYCGRKDAQVRVKDQLVNLEEIERQVREVAVSVRDVVAEAVLSTDKDVGQLLAVFVTGLTDVDGQEAASGFLSASQKHRDEAQRVTELLNGRLPSNMVPDVIIPLARLPARTNGKTPRQLLRVEAAALTKEQVEQYQPGLSVKRAPESELQKTLQVVVADVLGLDLEDFSIDDSFFRLGGDSIIAIRLVERARSKGFTFRVSDVFQSPKLSDLSRFVASGEESAVTNGTTSSSELIGKVDKGELVMGLAAKGFPCTENDVDAILPVTQAAERYLLQTPEYWIINLRGAVDVEGLERACSDLVLRHGILRSVFVSDQGRFLQLVLSRMKTIVRHFQTTLAIADFVEDHRRRDVMKLPTLDMPLTEFLFVQSSANEEPRKALVLRLSHAQFDGYCLLTLWQDLKQLYEGGSLPPAVPYSLHLQQWKQSHTDDGFAFWRDTLKGSSIARIDNTTFGDEAISLEDSEFVTTSRLIHIGESLPRNTTAATIVKAAWAVVLARLSGHNDGVFAQASNGRSYDSAKDVVGMCLNFIPVRSSVDAAATVPELVDAMQRQHHQSLAHELIDFDEIVRRSTSWAEGSRHQTVLLHQNLDPDEEFCLGEAEAWVTCCYEWPHPPDEILIESFPKGGGKLLMTMDTRSNVLSKGNADAVMDRLCRLIGLVARLAGDSGARVGGLLEAVG